MNITVVEAEQSIDLSLQKGLHHSIYEMFRQRCNMQALTQYDAQQIVFLLLALITLKRKTQITDESRC